jgi:2-isopropylmalate synthase
LGIISLNRYNFSGEKQMSKERIMIFDTTLRDGEQAAGTRLGAREKLEIARQLTRLKVDIIEAGFPASSPEDFEAVRLISEQIEGPIICGLTRAIAEDIEVCTKALAKAKRSRIHTGIGVSEIHIAGKFADDKYGKTMGQKQANILKMAVEAVKQAAQYTDDVEFYAEDSGRANRNYLYEILEAVIEAGATVVNIPDTTGYAIPEQYGALIRDIQANVPNIGKATISVHCHDDLGMAVANSLAGVKNGARQVEGTLNGVGERAGNAAIEEVVMAIHTRPDFFEEVETGINKRELYRTSRMVADMLGMPVPANKAVVGRNAFAHSSGIHVDGFLKKRETYEIMRPEVVGFGESRVVLTARTGRHGLRHRLEEMGYTLTKDELDKTYERFLAVADKKKEVFDEDLAAIISDEIHVLAEQTFELQYLHVACGTGTLPTASVKMKIKDEVKQAAACGDGPVDAAYEAIRQATGLSPKLENYSIQAITGGKEALGEATVRIKDDGRTFIGRGISTDIIEASAKAYVDAINRMVTVQGKGEQQEVKVEL